MRKAATQMVICGDCVKVMGGIDSKSVDIAVTSPPYNLNIKYSGYNDNLGRNDYLLWLEKVFALVKRSLKDDGSFFLNIGASNKDPWVHMDVANVARGMFMLQNDVVWIKSVAIDDITYGHFKPINSPRYLNHTYEHLFHFTKEGNVPVDRKAVGVPYVYKSNIKRFAHTKGSDLRCKGNCWYIPYNTIQDKRERGYHPATFPERLVGDCIKLHGYTKDTVVLDPFCGSGTTLYVAKELNVNAVGIELDKAYVKHVRKNLMGVGCGTHTT